MGYAFLDRGFASLPYSPLFVGEIALLGGLFVAAAGSVSLGIFRSRVSWLVLAYMGWGLLVALPDFGVYGLLVYRDSAVWTYSFFALLVGGALMKSGLEPRVLDWFGRWFPWFLFWAPAAFLLSAVFQDSLPRVPGSDVPILAVKPGDIGVHIAGAGAFMLLGLHKVHPVARALAQRRDLILWSAWTVGFVILGAKTRGGMLAVVAALALVLAFRRTKQSPRLLLGAGLALAAFALFFTVVGELQFNDRTISISQVVDNAVSIVDSSDAQLAGTINWRLNWWDKVVHYTIFGDNFWTGKGFGINLADSDGFQTDGKLRSPHNGHITILARSGVPGLALWLMVLAAFYATMFRSYLSARRFGQQHFANATLWVLAYTTALLVNMSFDVYLEGPQGGIWFWSVIGFGIALSERQRRQRRASPLPAPTAGRISALRPLAAGSTLLEQGRPASSRFPIGERIL